MESVGAQPAQPSGSQSGSTKKFTNILNPLRKSNQAKDLSHLSQGQYVISDRIASPGPPQLELSGSPRSPLLSYSPPPFQHQSGGSGIGKSSYFLPHSISGTSGQNPLIAYQQYATMQSGTRRSKDHSVGKIFESSSIPRRRSRSEDNENVQQRSSDQNYIPYHGPISPKIDDQSIITPSGLVGYPQTQTTLVSSGDGGGEAEGTPSSLIGLGLSDTDRKMSRYTPSYLTMPQRSQSSAQESLQPNQKTSPTTMHGEGSVGRKGGATMGIGLPTSYTHGGNAPSDVYSPRSGALKDSLPSSMRFDREQGTSGITSPSSSSWAFRRDPFYAGQSQAGPSTQARASAFPPSSGQLKEVRLRLSNNTLNSTRRAGIGANSNSSSPKTVFATMHRQDSSAGSSSEGHAGSFGTTYAGPVKTQNSASTSLTSLREGSLHLKASGSGLRNASIDQRSIPRTSMQQQRLQHRKADSRSTLNSQGTRPSTSDREADLITGDMKGKSANTSRIAGGAGSVRSIYSGQSSDAIGSFSSPSGSQRIATLSMEEARPSGTGDKSTGSVATQTNIPQHSEPVSLQPGELVPPRFIQTLSPIAASSSGETGYLSQIERFEPTSASLSQTWSENFSPPAPQLGQRNPFSSASASRLVEGPSQTQQDPIVEESEHGATAADQIRREATAEAQRRFTLLQQLHLDELSAHAPEAGGWLEPKNGCERVLMPRPTLKGGRNSLDRYADGLDDGYCSEGGQALRHSSRISRQEAAFERNRRMPGTYPRDSDGDVSRAQALLGQDQISVPIRAISENRPFFHHRMPPDAPHSEGVEIARAPVQEKWILEEERPTIPVRTSSRRGHRKRLQNQVSGLHPSTPALTPNLMSDSDDEDIPESSIVLAQGRALEQEREKWREQHRKSFGAVDSSYRRSHSQHRKSTRNSSSKSSGKKSAQKDQVGLRQSRSSPDMRQRLQEKNSQDIPPPMPNSPLATSCFPISKRHETNQEQRLASSRTRSKSLEGFSRFRASAFAAAASLATPCVGQYSSQKQEGGRIPHIEKEGERRRSKTGTTRGRAVTLSIYDDKVQRASLRPDERVTHDRPFVISRTMEEKSTSPGLGKGPLQVRHPSWYLSSTSANRRSIDDLELPPSQAVRTTVDHFGAAISSPRPDLGLSNTQDKSQEDFSTAGRYATKKGYHRPSSSDELAAYLNMAAAKRSNEQGHSQNTPAITLFSKEKDSSQEKRPVRSSGESLDEEDKRRLSLGMSRIFDGVINPEHSINLGQTPDSEIIMRSRPQESLPVPPRRTRSSSTPSNSANSSSRSPPEPSNSPLLDQVRPVPYVEMAPDPTMMSSEVSKVEKFGIPQSPFTNLHSGFTAQNKPFQTPPLVQPFDDGEWFRGQSQSESRSQSQDQSLDKKQLGKMTISSPLRHNQHQSGQSSAPLGVVQIPISFLDEQDPQFTEHQRSLSGSGRLSSEDTASQHSREMLWNTDEHGDEAFNSLFFRKPSQTMSRDLSGLASIYSQQSNNSSTPIPDRQLRDVNLPHQSPSVHLNNENHYSEDTTMQEDMERDQREEVGDVTQASIAQASSAHAADTTIERMMSNLLRFQTQSRTSMDRSTRLGRESALDDNESAWNESSIGEHYAPPQGSINISSVRAADNSTQPSSSSAPVSRVDQILGMRLGRVSSGRQPQIQGASHEDSSSRPSTRLRERVDTMLSDVNDADEGEESAIMEDDQNSSPMKHELLPKEKQRQRVESFAASVLMYPTSDQGSQHNSSDEAEPRQSVSKPPITPAEVGSGFIDFASPAAPRPLSLAEEVPTGSFLQQVTGPSTSSARLAPPSLWQANTNRSSAVTGSDSGSENYGQHPRPDSDNSTQRRESEGIMTMVRSRVWPTPPFPSTEFESQSPTLPSANDSIDRRE